MSNPDKTSTYPMQRFSVAPMLDWTDFLYIAGLKEFEGDIRGTIGTIEFDCLSKK